MGQALGCIQVKQSTVAVREQFGKFDTVLEPGCHCLPQCLGYRLAGELSLRVQQLKVKCETKTKDNVFVNVVVSIQYRVLQEKAPDAFYKLTDTRQQILSYVVDSVGARVSKLDLEAAFEQKKYIAKAVQEELEKAMLAYGFEIVQTLISAMEPDTLVKKAMNASNAVARLWLATGGKADTEKKMLIKLAKVEAEGIGASSKSSTVLILHGPGSVRDMARAWLGQGRGFPDL